MSTQSDPDVLPTDVDTEVLVETEEAAAEVEAVTAEPVPEPEPVPAADPVKDLQEQLLRLRADFENFRKRTRREKEEWTVRSLEHICGDLLPVLDSFELGLKNAGDLKLSEDVLKGFVLVREQLRNVLGKYGLSDVDAENQAFDPNLHEAIAQVPSPEIAAGQVMAMTRRGYKLGERLLRPAQVVVSQGAPETAAAEESVVESEDA